jgi:hypothetical protein
MLDLRASDSRFAGMTEVGVLVVGAAALDPVVEGNEKVLQ